MHVPPGTHLMSGVTALSVPSVRSPPWPRQLWASSLTSEEGGC